VASSVNIGPSRADQDLGGACVVCHAGLSTGSHLGAGFPRKEVVRRPERGETRGSGKEGHTKARAKRDQEVWERRSYEGPSEVRPGGLGKKVIRRPERSETRGSGEKGHTKARAKRATGSVDILRHPTTSKRNLCSYA
jgi:hypothetical protein